MWTFCNEKQWSYSAVPPRAIILHSYRFEVNFLFHFKILLTAAFNYSCDFPLTASIILITVDHCSEIVIQISPSNDW